MNGEGSSRSAQAVATESSPASCCIAPPTASTAAPGMWNRRLLGLPSAESSCLPAVRGLRAAPLLPKTARWSDGQRIGGIGVNWRWRRGNQRAACALCSDGPAVEGQRPTARSCCKANNSSFPVQWFRCGRKASDRWLWARNLLPRLLGWRWHAMDACCMVAVRPNRQKATPCTKAASLAASSRQSLLLPQQLHTALSRQGRPQQRCQDNNGVRCRWRQPALGL